MTNYLFTGAALANYKACLITPGVNADNTAIVLIGLGQYQLTFTGFSASAIVAAWNTSTNPFFNQITASVSGDGVLFVSNTLGLDFELTCTINGVSGGTVSTIQVLNITATGGTFTLSDGTTTSGAIIYSVTPATLVSNIQTAINAMSGYSSGDVVVSHTGSDYLLNFGSGRFAGLNVTLWTANGASLTGGTALATITMTQVGNAGADEHITVSFPATGTHTAIVNEIQTITMGGSVTSGTFTLSLSGYGTTPPLPFTAGRSIIKQALEDLLGLHTVKVTGGPLATVLYGSGGNAYVTGTLTDIGWGNASSWTPTSPAHLVGGGFGIPLLRFTLNIPANAVILSATLTTACTVTNNGIAHVRSYTGAADASFPADYNAFNIMYNAGGVSSTGTPLAATTVFDAIDSIQSIVNIAGWTAGNHAALFIDADAAGGTFAGGSISLAIEYQTVASYAYNPADVEFIGSLAGTNLAQMTTSGLATVSTLQDGGSQTVNNITGGTWGLVLTDPTTSQVYNINNIPYNVTHAALQTLIEGVCGVGSATVAGGPAPGTPLTISFIGAMSARTINESAITALTGNFASSTELTTLRSTVTCPVPQNIWDLTVIPGEGTLAVSSGDPLITRGVIVLTISEPAPVNPVYVQNTSIYIPLYGINPSRVEDAINEAFGKDVVRVTRVVHSQEQGVIPANQNIGSTTAEASDLHFWYFRDVFRLVFCNDYQASGSILNMNVTTIATSNINSTPADPSVYMTASAPPATADGQDFYREAERVYLGFTNYITNGGPRFDSFAISQNTNRLEYEQTFRAKIVTKYPTTDASDVARRVGIAKLFLDNTITFSLVQYGYADFSETTTQHVVATAAPLNWDASPDQISAALQALVTGFFGAGNVVVWGTLYNSWLSEAAVDSASPLSTYQDLHIRLTGLLSCLPITDLGYDLICTISNPNPTNTEQLRSPEIWIEPYSKPLPGGLNQRQRFVLDSPGSVTSLVMAIDNSIVITGLTPATTVAQLQTAINTAIGTFPVGMLPAKWSQGITVYGTTLASPVELEFSGYGYQFTAHTLSFGVFNDNTLILVTRNQTGVYPVSEVQSLAITGSPHGGTYTVNGSGNIAYNAVAAAIQTAIGAAPPTVAGTYPNFTLTWPSASGSVALWPTTSSLNNSSAVVRNTGANTQSGGKGASFAIADTVQGAGPTYFDCPLNYTPVGVPGRGDTMTIDDALAPIYYGINQSSNFVVSALAGSVFQYTRNRQVFQNGQKVHLKVTGTAPTGLVAGNEYFIINQANDYTFGLSATLGGSAIVVSNVGAGTFELNTLGVTLLHHSRYSGNQIGLPNNNAATSLPEYLPKYLRLAGVQATIGIGDGNGLNMLRLDTGDDASNVTINNSGQSQVDNIPAINLLFNNVASTLLQLDGDVGIAPYSYESSSLDSITCSGGSSLLHNVTLAGDMTYTNGIKPTEEGTIIVAGVSSMT